MKAKQLKEVISEGGIPWVNFFNGRLLSGEDLSSEQHANQTGLRRLGRAVGSGVAFGLEVSAPDKVNTLVTPEVTVQPGLAVNGEGQTLSLTEPARVSLTRPSNAEAAAGLVGDDFGDCLPLQAGNYIATTGVYLLTIAPARKAQGRAPVSGLDNITAHCNTRYNVEGVQFRLIQIDLSASDLADARRLRNRAAYHCFGFGAGATATYKSDLANDTFGGAALLDRLDARVLTECDVPLALINWTTTGGIVFVDMWSVRRRIAGPSAGGRWDALFGERSLAEGEAMFLQFQHQLEDLAKGTNPQNLLASEHFAYLPPVGIVPQADTLTGDGFDYLKFFSGLTHREPVYIEGAKIEPLFRTAITYAPTDLSTGEMMWLYWVRQNMDTINDKPSNPPRAYLIFTSGHVPYQGQAQYDLAHWDYGNYAI